MIDVTKESLITMSDLQKIVPVGRATLYRWISSGMLDSIKLGGRRFTSREAIARFAVHGPQPSEPSRRNSARAHDDAEAVMERLRKRLGGFD